MIPQNHWPPLTLFAGLLPVWVGHMSSMEIACDTCMISSVGVVTILDFKGSW